MAICADGRDGGGGSSGGSEMQTLGLRRLGYRPRRGDHLEQVVHDYCQVVELRCYSVVRVGVGDGARLSHERVDFQGEAVELDFLKWHLPP
jgi:hypothetical protein